MLLLSVKIIVDLHHKDGMQVQPLLSVSWQWASGFGARGSAVRLFKLSIAAARTICLTNLAVTFATPFSQVP